MGFKYPSNTIICDQVTQIDLVCQNVVKKFSICDYLKVINDSSQETLVYVWNNMNNPQKVP